MDVDDDNEYSEHQFSSDAMQKVLNMMGDGKVYSQLEDCTQEDEYDSMLHSSASSSPPSQSMSRYGSQSSFRSGSSTPGFGVTSAFSNLKMSVSGRSTPGLQSTLSSPSMSGISTPIPCLPEGANLSVVATDKKTIDDQNIPMTWKFCPFVPPDGRHSSLHQIGLPIKLLCDQPLQGGVALNSVRPSAGFLHLLSWITSYFDEDNPWSFWHSSSSQFDRWLRKARVANTHLSQLDILYKDQPKVHGDDNYIAFFAKALSPFVRIWRESLGIHYMVDTFAPVKIQNQANIDGEQDLYIEHANIYDPAFRDQAVFDNYTRPIDSSRYPIEVTHLERHLVTPNCWLTSMVRGSDHSALNTTTPLVFSPIARVALNAFLISLPSEQRRGLLLSNKVPHNLTEDQLKLFVETSVKTDTIIRRGFYWLMLCVIFFDTLPVVDYSSKNAPTTRALWRALTMQYSRKTFCAELYGRSSNDAEILRQFILPLRDMFTMNNMAAILVQIVRYACCIEAIILKSERVKDSPTVTTMASALTPIAHQFLFECCRAPVAFKTHEELKAHHARGFVLLLEIVTKMSLIAMSFFGYNLKYQPLVCRENDAICGVMANHLDQGLKEISFTADCGNFYMLPHTFIAAMLPVCFTALDQLEKNVDSSS